ncbi:MAG: tRNA lysidine(34) synthetase TilS [Candidatus Binatia bacterium]
MRHALAILLGTVQRSIRAHAMLSAGDRVLVAVSGGADSVGLLLVLSQLRRKLGIEVVAAHVHHGLRGVDADADEACAAAAAARLGVVFARVISAAGCGRVRRTWRRGRGRCAMPRLRRLATAHGCTRIATGHTLDDQAETVLMRLLRGAGVRGLAAIRPRRRDGVVRPLLDCRRSAVRAVVEQAGLAFRHDAANDDPRFLRTHVRRRVLPLLGELNPAIAEACAGLAASARAGAPPSRAGPTARRCRRRRRLRCRWPGSRPSRPGRARCCCAAGWPAAGCRRAAWAGGTCRRASRSPWRPRGAARCTCRAAGCSRGAVEASRWCGLSLRRAVRFAAMRSRYEPLPQDMCHVRLPRSLRVPGVM